MDKLGLDTISKKGKFVEKINELSGGPSTGTYSLVQFIAFN